MNRTRRKWWLFDRGRARARIEGDLTLILDAGSEDEDEFVISGGWYPFNEHRPSEPNSIFRIEVVERDELTTEIMARADRLRMQGVTYAFSYDPPPSSPFAWTLYATELKEGGLR
jgi:hypothetical protein